MKKIISSAILLVLSSSVYASPACDGPGETYVSWPATGDPVWEMCYLPVDQSSATQGSSLEIRNVHYNGHLLLERSHIPMLFANYEDPTCYRDWKNTPSSFLKADSVDNPTQSAITTCDASSTPTGIAQDCPFDDVVNGGNVGNSSDCMTGVQVEKHPGYLLLTTNHSAAWYKYAARYYFYPDGTIKPRFGFGNSNGTNFGVTHRHHAYWRFDFDIDGSDNDQVYITEGGVDTLQNDEFSDLRDMVNQDVTWKVIDSVTGRGVHVVPTSNDTSENGSSINEYNMPADESLDGFHEVDVMATRYKLYNNDTLPEYSDTPGANVLQNCSMDENKLVGSHDSPGVPESLVGENVVLWYRTAVKDLANQGMVCKSGGPSIVLIGNWSPEVPGVYVDVPDVGGGSPSPGLTVSESSGSSLSFGLQLNSQPTADVVIQVTSSDTTEGVVDTAQLTFTTANWQTQQDFMVTGQDDADFDDDVNFQIDFVVTSTDVDYDGMVIESIDLINIDDEVPNDIIFEHNFDQ